MSARLDLAVVGDVVRADGTVLRDGWLGIRGESVAEVSAEPLDADRVRDARGKLVMPGFIDVHVHTRSDPEEGIAATTFAAAAGGTTTVIDMPYDRPARPVRSPEALRAKIADVNREAVVDVALYATFAPQGPLDAIADMAAEGACAFKASTVQVDADRFPRIPDGQLFEAFQEIARCGLPVAAHQENQDIVDFLARRFRARGRSNPRAYARSRPPVAEAEAAGRLLELARFAGARLHMVHGTIPRTFDLIEWHRATGTRATGETCIQYLVLTDAALRRLGGRAKCNPPLRSRQAVDGLWERLADGRIDIVTSDHSPYGPARKDTPNVFDAWAGLPGVETLGTLLYSRGVAAGRITLGRFQELLCAGPARIFGLSRKGVLEAGRDADFVVFDPVRRRILDERALQHRVGWSPYHGHEAIGEVSATFVRGRCVFDGGRVIGEPGTGRFLRPG